MKYKTTCAILIKGDRVEKGQIVDISPELAKHLKGDVEPVEAETKAEPEPTPEKPLEEMNHAELKEKAKELDLKQSGSIADLRERITLHLESKSQGDDVEMIDHIITEEDLVNNPDLVKEGVKVGDVIQIPDVDEEEEDLQDDNKK